VALADKLHNLTSILLDLQEKRPIWVVFNADRELSTGITNPRSPGMAEAILAWRHWPRNAGASWTRSGT